MLGLDIVKPNQQELKEKPSKLLCTQEKAQQYTIAFIAVSDWLKGWCTFSRPITKQKRANPKQSHIIFDT